MISKPKNVVDLSWYRRYNKEEREIIEYLQQDGPLTQEQINLALEQARSIHGDDLKG
jgi:hypothetical protein